MDSTSPPNVRLGLLALLSLAFAGCATPGPLHVYSVFDDAAPEIADLGAGATATVPSYLEPDDTLTGFAYDPFTDHFFLRLAPGNKIRVVDRPARAIKREFTIEALPAEGGGDLAVRPRDGHLFFLHAREPAITETTRLGKPLRTFALAGLRTAAIGLALDPAAQELFVLHPGNREVSVHRTDGARLRRFTLERAVKSSLALDVERRELFAPLADEPAVGVFALDGKFLRRLDTPPARFVDVGPRSFVRVF